jgi:small-conductance mechanosensitive channel
MEKNIFIIAGALLATVILLLALAGILKKRKKTTFFKGLKVKVEKLILPVGSLICSVIATAVLPYLRLSDDVRSRIAQLLSVWVITSMGSLGVIAVQILKEAILKRYDINESDNLKARRIYTQIGVMQSIINVGIIVLTASCVIMVFPRMRQIGVSLLASAGVMGIVLGLAAQRTLGNLIAGIQLAITQPIRIDDVLVVENEWGWVEEITLTYVVVRIWDLRRLILPISYFIEKPFQNWTRISADILGSVYIYADYTVPIDKMREELTRILEASPHWDKKVNVLQVTNATDKSIEVRALMSAKNSPLAWQLRCEVRERLLVYLQKNFPECLPRIRLEMNKDQV